MAPLRSYYLTAAITLLTSALCARGKIVDIPYYSWYDFDMSPFNTSDDTPVTCTVRMPDGEECVFEAGSGPVGTAPICKDMSYSGKPNLCKIHLSNVYKYLQPYIITAEYGDQATFTEYFYLPEKVKGVPLDSALYVVGTSHLFVRLSTNVVDMTECSVFQYDTEFPLLETQFSSNLVYWGKAGECGVDIAIPDDFGASFMLWTANKTHTYYSEFKTVVTPSNETFIPEEPLVLERGSIVSIGENNKFIRTCKITTPTKRTATSAQGCTYRADVVTDAYAGNWTFEYWVQGEMMSRVTTRLVRVVETSKWPQLLVGSVTQSERFERGIDIRCERTNGVLYHHCKFMRPDGIELQVEPGVGTQEYTYLDTCAITIVEPAQRDFGMWKCSDGVNTTFLLVSNGTDYNTITSWVGEHPYYVKRGDTVELTCGMNAPLQYCWFNGPNGMLPFSTVVQDYGPSKYVYDPAVLQNGTCKLIIYNVDFEYRDNLMSCWLGVEGMLDYELSVSVIISDTYMTIEDLYGWQYINTGKTTTVNCHSVPKGQPIEYCRFVRPDGQGISLIPGYSNVSLDYSYDGAGLLAGDCGILIHSVVYDDIGKWTCMAMLQNDPTRESFDEYELIYNSHQDFENTVEKQ